MRFVVSGVQNVKTGRASVPRIFRQSNGYELDWPADDDGHFDGDHKDLLGGICAEYDVPFGLIARLLEAERRAKGMARRVGIYEALAAELAREWRNEAEILAQEPVQPRQV